MQSPPSMLVINLVVGKLELPCDWGVDAHDTIAVPKEKAETKHLVFYARDRIKTLEPWEVAEDIGSA